MEKDLTIIKKEIPDLLKSIVVVEIPKDLQPYVKPALEEFKNEMAKEIGLVDFDKIDKDKLSSSMLGKVGGSMVKQMVKFSESVLAWNYRNRLILEKDRDGDQY